MKQSALLTKTRKDIPKDEVSKNAILLTRAGYVNKEIAGVYSYLPLGLRVLNKINNIVREEMNAIGGQELFLTALQDSESWKATDRWDAQKVNIWFKTKLLNDTELGLAFTHEEPLTALMKSHIRSFRDLPVYPYQIQTKFRNEARAKSGIMRGREFLMKDLYSFSKDEKEHNAFYEKAKKAYKKVFERVGLGDITYITFASGGSFSKYSHEFQTVTPAGEDTIHVCEKCLVAVNNEVIKEQSVCPECGNKKLVEKYASEVGNIFTLGTKFSEPLGLFYTNEKGEKNPVFMGSYGIGPGRVMGTAVEVFSDDKGIIWPKSIAPFQVHLVEISENSGKVKKSSEDLYKKLENAGIEVLYDDRDCRPGEKFADSDLLGIPLRIVISEKNLKDKVLEIKHRANGKVEMIKEENILTFVEKNK